MTDIPTLAASLTPKMREALCARLSDYGAGRYRLSVPAGGSVLAGLIRRRLIDKHSELLLPTGLAVREYLKESEK